MDAFKNKVDVTKLIDEQGNTTVTVMAKENVTMPELKLYRANMNTLFPPTMLGFISSNVPSSLLPLYIAR